MPGRRGRLFAGRGISLPGAKVTVLTVLVAFILGVSVGWGTTLVASRIGAESPSPTPSTSPSATPSATPEVSVPPTAPIDRPLDDADRAAGLTTLFVPLQGDGTFTPVPALPAQTGDSGITKLVRIDIEDGLTMSGAALSSFVMAALNDARGWGEQGTLHFVQTDGAPDIRVVFASPYTTALLCPTPHAPAPLTPATPPTATPTPSGAPGAIACAAQDVVLISLYDWAAGLSTYAGDRTESRAYLLSHGMGHVLGKSDGECKKGVADVMVDQRTVVDACTVNPWPFPNAKTNPSATPGATIDATP